MVENSHNSEIYYQLFYTIKCNTRDSLFEILYSVEFLANLIFNFHKICLPKNFLVSKYIFLYYPQHYIFLHFIHFRSLEKLPNVLLTTLKDGRTALPEPAKNRESPTRVSSRLNCQTSRNNSEKFVSLSRDERVCVYGDMYVYVYRTKIHLNAPSMLNLFVISA